MDTQRPHGRILRADPGGGNQAVPGELEAAGVRRRDVTLVCAKALHRILRPSELARLPGDDLVREFGARLICHDAVHPTLIVDLGVTDDHGFPVEVYRLVAESELTVYVMLSSSF